MPSETFYCPHCRHQLRKSAKAYVMGEAYATNSPFLNLGFPPGEDFCPDCRGKIDVMKVISGEYDIDPTISKYINLYFIMVIIAIIVFKWVCKWSWVGSILVGIIAGLIIAQVIVGMLKGDPDGHKLIKKNK